MLLKFLPDAQKAAVPFDISAEEFLPVNVSSVAKRLDLVSKASIRGKRNLPPTATSLPDDVESSIHGEIAIIAHQAQSALANHFSSFRARLTELLVDDLADRIRSGSEQSKTTLFGDVRNGSNLLFSAKRNVFLAESSLEEFRRKNKLNRPAKYPDSHCWHGSLIFFLFVIETVANATFLAQANQFGLIGGVMEMFAISFINVMLGFCCGLFLLRGLHLLSVVKRLLIALLVVIVFAISVAFNLFVGHYRDVLAALTAEPTSVGLLNLGQLAVNRFAESTFQLQDFKSWIMSIIGVILSGVVAYKAYTWDDPYPGYGAIVRHYKSIFAEYGRSFERLQNRLAAMAKDGIAELDRLYDQAKGYTQEHAEIANRVRTLQKKFRAYAITLEGAAQTLLQTYRHENIANRSEPPPPAFETTFKLDQELSKPPEFEAPKPIDLRSLNGTVTAARKAIETQHATLLQVYRTIDQLTVEQAQTFDPRALLETAVQQSNTGNGHPT